MRQLAPVDVQFLGFESATTVGHVGSLVLLDPGTAPGGVWNLEAVRNVIEPRLHLTPVLRQRLVEVPLGLGRPYWVDDPHFDIEFHLRELALPPPGTEEQLGEQVARIHARPLDRARPLWEGYVITGIDGGRAALYAKIHHAAVDGVAGMELFEAFLDPTAEPRETEPEDGALPRESPSGLPWGLPAGLATGVSGLPSSLTLLRKGLISAALTPLEVLRSLPRALPHLDVLPGVPTRGRRGPAAPWTPLNGPITPHRRFAHGSVPMRGVKRIQDPFGMSVNEVVMAGTAAALRRWLLDHDALPGTPLVVAVPVSVRASGSRPEEPDRASATPAQDSVAPNQVSVMTMELPTHLADPLERLEFSRVAAAEAKRHFAAVPATLLQDLARAVPPAVAGLASRTLLRLAPSPGVLVNLVVSNVRGPASRRYLAGARVEHLYPVSAVSDLTGGLNISVFSYDGHLDVGLIACREMVPDVWNLVGYLQAAMRELEKLA